MSTICPRKPMTCQKLKYSANKVKRAKAQVKHYGSDVNATPDFVPKYTIPPPDRHREEARIQAEVQNRLRQRADNAKPGTEKNQVPKGGGSVDVFVSNRVK